MFATSSMLAKSAVGKLKASDFMSTSSNDTQNPLAEENEEYRIGRSFMTDAYRVNPWIRAIVDLTSERFDQVELFPIPLCTNVDTKSGDYPDAVKRKMEDVMNLLMKPNDDYESFSSLKKKIIHDILTYDEAGMQIIRSRSPVGRNKKPFGLMANVTGEELYVNSNDDGTLKTDKAFVQLRGGRIIAHWNKFDFMNFIKNRRAGYSQGLSPIESIAASILGDIEAMNYNLKFFENNARPNIAFIFKNLGFGSGKGALDRAKQWYMQNHAGKPHLPLFMGSQKGEVEIKELTVSNKDMEFNNWQIMLLSRIMACYGMQPMVLGVLTDTTGKLNSEVQTEEYKKNAIIPLVKLFTNTFNSVLLWSMDNFGYTDIHLTSENLDIDDEKKQAEIWDMFLRDGVITINQVRSELRMPPVDWGNVPFVPLNMSPLDILTKYHESQIESNRKNAMSDKLDNNLKPEKKGQEPPKKSTAKKEIDPQTDYMMDNYNVPSGLEQVDPQIILKAVGKLIHKRESRPSYHIMGSKDSHSLTNSMGLSWDNILKKR